MRPAFHLIASCLCPSVIVRSARSALQPREGLEMQRSIKDKLKLEYSFFIVEDVFCTSLFVMYCFSFISESGESYIIALFFAWLPGVSFSLGV